jgi:hypothetical protein
MSMPKNNPADAVALLKADHQKVAGLPKPPKHSFTGTKLA